MFTKNEGTLDRDIRLALGVLLIIPTVFMLHGVLQVVAGLVAAVLVLTAASGVCPLYAAMGVRTTGRRD